MGVTMGMERLWDQNQDHTDIKHPKKWKQQLPNGHQGHMNIQHPRKQKQQLQDGHQGHMDIRRPLQRNKQWSLVLLNPGAAGHIAWRVGLVQKPGRDRASALMVATLLSKVEYQPVEQQLLAYRILVNLATHVTTVSGLHGQEHQLHVEHRPHQG